MNQRHSLRVFSAIALVASTTLAGCDDGSLAITNPNNPDVARVYGNPRDVETIVSKLFQQEYNGLYGSADDIWTQAMVMSFESHSQLGNFGMGTRAAIPRALIDNTIGNSVNPGNLRDFNHMTRNSRSAANAVAALDGFIAENKSTGSAVRDFRAKAFGYFASGYALGNLSLLYDSAAVITPKTDVNDIPPFSGAADVNKVALEMLDSAISNAAKATGQSIPGDWISAPGGTAMTMTDFTRLMRSFKARFRAGMARTPAERAAVNWNEVVADATNGITGDFIVMVNASTGWSGAVLSQLATSTGWSQVTPFIIGMADTTGAYQAWLQQSISTRSPFLIRTPDKRFPAGDTRDAQTAASGGASRNGTPTGSILYFRNRPSGEDTPAEPWGASFYDNHRFWAIRAGGGNGPFVLFAAAENDMLAAEGYLRTNQVAKATPLIDKYRTRAGLPAIGAVSDAKTTVPGGSACVPRVPVGPAFNTTACGDVFEAMKWEKRIETSFTGYSAWFIDSRGWGDLVKGTPLEWPVPYQELQPRQLTIYTNSRVAAAGTYGF